MASCCYVIYLVSSGHGTVSQVLGFTMAMGNTYGVLLLSLLMGNGLVAIPLSLGSESFALAVAGPTHRIHQAVPVILKALSRLRDEIAPA